MDAKSELARIGLRVTTLTLILMAGCTSALYEHEWRSTSLGERHYAKLLICADGLNSALGRSLQDQLASGLAVRHVSSTLCYSLANDETPFDEQQLSSAAREYGDDAALLLHGKERQILVTYPGSFVPGPYWYHGYYYDPWLMGGWYEPPQTVAVDAIDFEVKLLDASSGALVWTGALQERSHLETPKAVKRFAEQIADSLAERKLIPAAPD